MEKEQRLEQARQTARRVTADSYPEFARNTEAVPKTDQLIEKEKVAAIESTMLAVAGLTDLADQLKRQVFYYKGTGKEAVRLQELNETLLECPIGVVFWPSKGLNEAAPKTLTPEQYRLLHAFLGMFTEAGELLKAWADHVFGGTPLDRVNVLEELGDSAWYSRIPMELLKASQTQVEQANIAKLIYRYPNKFNSTDAVERDLPGERQLLEEFLAPPTPPKTHLAHDGYGPP